MTLHTTLAPAAVDETPSLEELADRALLDELCQSLLTLFGLPVRIFSNSGTIFGALKKEHDLCSAIVSVREGRHLCSSTVDQVKALVPEQPTLHGCFSGLAYHIEPIRYETQIVGRVVIGPFALPTTTPPSEDPGKKLLQVVGEERVPGLYQRVPRAKPETVSRVAAHLRTTLDILLFNAHKTLMTSSTHLVTVRESYRELAEKTSRLEAAYSKLKEADRLKASFLATVSHELKTPLTSILGYSEMLMEGIAGPMTDEQRGYLQTVHEKGQHLLDMITGLLDLSKMEIGTMRMKGQVLMLYTVLSEVVSTLVPAALKKGVILQMRCQLRDFAVRVDPTRMRQVFTNLVENAIKFTEPGGTVTVEDSITSLSEDDNDGFGAAIFGDGSRAIEVRVTDTGPGIPVAERERIFEAFYQVDSSSTREHGGTGLGLAIAKRVVVAHGGKIEVRDNEVGGRGSVFCVVLPAHDLPRVSVPAVALFDDPAGDGG